MKKYLVLLCLLCFSSFLFAISKTSEAAALLHCDITYGGDVYTINTRPSNNPYTATEHDIAGRFKFKSVIIAHDDQTIDYIKLYVYVQHASKDRLVHQATLLPPFTLAPTPLTPKNYLYAGAQERELRYQCALQETPQ